MLRPMTDSMESLCRAVVVAGGMKTNYEVRGAGPVAVLLSCEATEDSRIPTSLCDFRVFSPIVPGDRDVGTLSTWLDGFLDGLGLGQVVLVVDPPLEPFGRAYAAAAPERVSAVSVREAIDLGVSPSRLGA